MNHGIRLTYLLHHLCIEPRLKVSEVCQPLGKCLLDLGSSPGLVLC